MSQYRIVCVEGELKGSEIELKPSERIIVGREPRIANLVFRDMTISRKHCLIELDADGNYYVTDYSEAGLTSEDGITFVKEERTTVEKGIILNIGKAGTKIGLE